MEVMPNNLLCGFALYQSELESKAVEVLRSGWYILGNELKAFETEWAAYHNVKHCIGLASGLDALYLAFRSLGIGAGDEVIVQANTFIASVMGITMNGATPVFVEPDEYYGIDAAKIEEKVTSKTKAVLAVHLYGIPCDMERIVEICKKHNLYLVEDCAQSHGADYRGKKTGTFGVMGCYSFYPTKNLGAFGDGGCILTDRDDLNEKLRMLRNYGSRMHYYNEEVGVNSRLDELQAGFLRVKLVHLHEIIKERQAIANRYDTGIVNSKIKKPKCRPYTDCVWHQYVVRCKERGKLARYLEKQGIGTIIHYPVPPHLSEAYRYLGIKKGEFPVTEEYADSVLSIPIYNGFTEEMQRYVIDAMNAF